MLGVWRVVSVSFFVALQFQLWNNFFWWRLPSEPISVAEGSVDSLPLTQKASSTSLSQQAKKSDSKKAAVAYDDEQYEEIILTDEFDFLEK